MERTLSIGMVSFVIILFNLFLLMGFVSRWAPVEIAIAPDYSLLLPSTGPVSHPSKPETLLPGPQTGSPALGTDNTIEGQNPSNESTTQETSGRNLGTPSLAEFRTSVMNGNSVQLAGIWVEDILAFRVKAGLTRHAPREKDTLSIYNWAWENGVVGLLIHDYRGGTMLYQLNPGVRIAAIYGNGGIDWYVSRGGTWYESKDSSSGGFYGPFRVWSCPECDFDISARAVHNRHYAGNHRLAFQRCVTVSRRHGLMIIEAYLDKTQVQLQEPNLTLDALENTLAQEL